MLVAACAPATSSRSEPAAQATAQSGPKRITAAVAADPPFLTTKLNPGGGIRGISDIEPLLQTGLHKTDGRGGSVPALAEAVPSIENGLWKLFPDGRMETRWTLKPGIQWHDGVQFTTADLLFTARLNQDRELPEFYSPTYNLIERIEALDTTTIVVTWRETYIKADALFGAPLLPRHLLEAPYSQQKGTFQEISYWTDGLVGTGPFKLREFVRGSHLVVEANPTYALGRPKVDEVLIRFIPDQNTLMAGILAGEIDLTLGKTLSMDQADQLRDRWGNGKIVGAPYNWIAMYPQFIDPIPRVLLDVRLRRALLHAIDREALANTLLPGLTSVAHSFLNPNEPEHELVKEAIVRYEHDSRRAQQLIESLGYGKASDGLMHDAAGSKLSIEIRTTDSDFNQKSMFIIGDYWRQVGVGFESFLISPQRARENEIWIHPGVQLVRNPNDIDGMMRYHGSQTPRPETRFQGGNRARYVNPELDALVDRFFATVPVGERIGILGRILHHMTDQAVLLGLFYDMDPTAIGNRLNNVFPNSQQARSTWNAHEWDVR